VAFKPEWEWDYAKIPNYEARLAPKCEAFLVHLRTGNVDTLSTTAETRPTHHDWFDGLTPAGHAYFAGHYRGEDFERLRAYPVGVEGDWRVGTQPDRVAPEMAAFNIRVGAAIAALDQGTQMVGVDGASKLNMIVVVACKLFEDFLRIHPYANGNGHIARAIIWLVMGRYKKWPRAWTIEPRTSDKRYAYLIVEARNGNREPLEQFILDCM
jgi:hypothetical protein